MGIFDLFKRKASPQESVSGEDPQDEGKKNTSNLEMDSERDVRRTQRALLIFTLVGLKCPRSLYQSQCEFSVRVSAGMRSGAGDGV